MKVRIGTRNRATEEVQTFEAEGDDYLATKAAALDQVPDGLQLLHVAVDRPEKFD